MRSPVVTQVRPSSYAARCADLVEACLRDLPGSEHYHPVKSWLGRLPRHGANRRRAEVPLTRRVLITGITGQDGSYLAEHLLARGHEGWGLVRGQANPRVPRSRGLRADVR